MMLKVAC